MNLRGPKTRIARALGIALTPKSGRHLERRPTPPGQHGSSGTRARKLSNYKRQLLEKQKLRAQYNISERQLANAFAAAVRLGGNTGEQLLQRLERRLDAVVLRAGLAPTIFAARQLVAHGHVRLNGRRATVPSMLLEPGAVIALGERARRIPQVITSLAQAAPPAWLALNAEAGSVTVRELPEAGRIPVLCQVALVVEFYSR